MEKIIVNFLGEDIKVDKTAWHNWIKVCQRIHRIKSKHEVVEWNCAGFRGYKTK